MSADWELISAIRSLISAGEFVETRGHQCWSLIDYPRVIFGTCPLVTVRRTAWKKALREMEWFLSGDPVCPVELRDWWRDQLGPNYEYRGGYGAQWHRDGYDQIEALYATLRDHPHSRRAIATTWHSADMARITEINQNPHTPTTCHGTVLQGWNRDGFLTLSVYQRSADVILGVPHNWMQYWALGVWLAKRLGCLMHQLIWTFGDLHLYRQHVGVAEEFLAVDRFIFPHYDLVYHGGDRFDASAFEIVQEVPAPIIVTKPELVV